VSCLIGSTSKQKRKIPPKYAYSLFGSHFFGFAKKTSNNPTFVTTVRAVLIWNQAGKQRFFNFVPVIPNLWLFVTFWDICDGHKWSHFEICDRDHECLDFLVFLAKPTKCDQTQNELLFADVPVSFWNSIGPKRKLQSLPCFRFTFAFQIGPTLTHLKVWKFVTITDVT